MQSKRSKSNQFNEFHQLAIEAWNMKQLKFQLQSESPLLFHNGQTADPKNPFAKQLKQLSSKRAKTDADLDQIIKVEWYASLYLNDEKRLCIPTDVLEAAFVEGAKKLKLGKQAQAGLFAVDHALLEFDGDLLSIDELWERDQNRFTKSAKIGRSKIMRTRFRANEWKAAPTVVYDPGLFNPSQVRDIIKITGEIVGIGDWRPKFGRFTSEQVV